nr:putative alpha/beta-Hydrolases superfamily protein [Tanacetum cinerariifolium]
MALLKRKNKTLLEAARTMLANSLLFIPFWAEAVNTAFYVQNRVLVTKPQNKTPYEVLHGKTPGEENVQQYVLFPVWSSGSINPQNTDRNASFEVKVPYFKGRKPQFKVHVSPSSNTQSQKHDDKTKREAKVPAVGQITSNSTNTFSAAGPSNNVVSPTHGKSSYVDSSQLPDDPNMPKSEDITYSDDEEDVGTKADLTNLETTITVSPIPTTRVHKDHYVIQIIGDLSLATQTRSMTRVAKDQGGNVVLLYVSKYHDVHHVINVSGRYKTEGGVQERLGKGFLQKVKEDGFIDVKGKTGEFLYLVTEDNLMERLNTNMHEAC